MSTLSIHRPQDSSTTEVDARFDALVRTTVPAQRDGHTEVDFGRVFDLDYGQRALAAVPVRRERVAHRAPTARPRTVTTGPMTTGPATAGRVRMTRRGRLVVTLTFLGLALALMTAFGGWATAGLTGGAPEPVRVIEVAPGDTLYDIAADLAAPGEIRTMVHRIQELNSLPGGQIAEGQKLAVPRG